MLRRILLFLMLFVLSGFSFAQPTASGPEALAGMSELERKTLALDIAVSSYYELRDMAERYGLSAEGSSEDIRARLYGYFGLEAPRNPSPESVVTIESASSFQSFSVENTTDRLMRLEGPLTLTMTTNDGFTHRITADEIVFNRDRNIVQADGSIHYTREGNGRSDEFWGDSLLVDLNTYSGVFLDGSYILEPASSGQRTLSFRFDKLLKRTPELTVLDSARVTACDEVPPHYFIKARKVWLFENGDWAFSNATLYVGTVPVLWLPFFYYPSDELLFHPVFGYRSREGTFVQTTTYLLGEKKQNTETSSSLSLFGGNDNAAKKAEGIFLRRTQQDTAKENAQGSASPRSSLTLLADIYSSLGAYVGVAGSFPFSRTTSLDFSLGLAVSRSLFLESNGYYSPFDASNSYASIWNSSNLLGLSLPFRFGASASYKYQKRTGTTNVSVAVEFPLYSDPFFEQDFNRRSESTTLLSSFGATSPSISKRSSMTQSIQASLSWSVPGSASEALLSNFSLSKLTSQLTWKTKTQPTTGLSTSQRRILAVDPQREFFYPDSFRPIDTSFSVSGTIFSFDSGARKERKERGGAQGEMPAAQDATEPAPSGSLPGQGETDTTAAAGTVVATETTGTAGITEAAAAAERDFSHLTFKIKWASGGSLSLEDKFRSTSWRYPEDVDGALSYFLFGWRGNARISSTTNFADDLLVLQTTTGFTSQDQLRPYLYDERTSPTTVHPYRLSDYAYKSSVLDASAALSLSPFSSSSILSKSSLQYSIGGTVFKNKYVGLSGTGVDASPVYASTWIGWDSEMISAHSLTASLAFALGKGGSQRLSFSGDLPPLLEKYTASYSLDEKYIHTNIQGIVSRASEDSELTPSSLTARIEGGGKPYPTLSQDFSWDFDAGAPLASSTALSYGWAKAGYTMKKSKGYVFSDGLWSTDGTEYFRPYELSFSLSPETGAASNLETTKAAENQSLKLRASSKLEYSQNLVRFTESTLSASFDLSLASAQGTSISFASVSANKSAWRYWPGLFPVTASFDPNDYYKNILTDLADSLSVWDTAALRKGLFKLQSLNLTLAQDLHDWNLAAALGMTPMLVTPDIGRPYYQLDFSFSLSVTWKDIPEIKTSLTYEEGAFSE